MSVPPLTGLRRPARTVIRPRCAWRTVLSFPVNCSVLFLSFPIVVRLVALCLASRMHCSKRKGASPRRKEVTSRRTQGVENLGCATCLSSVLSNLLRTILTRSERFWVPYRTKIPEGERKSVRILLSWLLQNTLITVFLARQRRSLCRLRLLILQRLNQPSHFS